MEQNECFDMVKGESFEMALEVTLIQPKNSIVYFAIRGSLGIRSR